MENVQSKREEIFSRLKKLLTKLFKLNDKKIEVLWDSDIIDDLGIDSVEVIDLLNSVEEEFDVNPSLSEANSKRKVSQIVDYIIELQQREM